MKKILVLYIIAVIFLLSLLQIAVYNENILEVEDITENEESSFVDILEECKKVKFADEKKLEKEICEEEEGFLLQDEQNISYNGENLRKWDVELGEYKGLTYYSQLDSRWKDKLYTATGNSNQTIGSSGCGPACASMIISSIKGDIKPDQVADIFVKYGYRSPNNGTYWSAYRAIADEFNIDYEETDSFDEAINLLENNYYIIVSCGNGLFTTGGHYIVLVGIKKDVLKIYDPYLYNGKFNTLTRRGKVTVKGNTVYCSITNFQKYANYKKFFCYKNSKTIGYEPGQKVIVDIPVNIAFVEGNRVLVDDENTQFWVDKSAISNNRVYGIATICYKNNDNYIVQFFDDQFWCNEANFVSTIQ